MSVSPVCDHRNGWVQAGWARRRRRRRWLHSKRKEALPPKMIQRPSTAYLSSWYSPPGEQESTVYRQTPGHASWLRVCDTFLSFRPITQRNYIKRPRRSAWNFDLARVNEEWRWVWILLLPLRGGDTGFSRICSWQRRSISWGLCFACFDRK